MTTREPIQIRVHLVEARALKGKEGDSDLVNPAVRVNLLAGPIKDSQRTEIYKDVSSVYFNETKEFEMDIGGDEFDEGRIQIQVEDDQGLFQPRLIGEASFDLFQVYESPSHELFNRWVLLLHPDMGGEIQGFLRVCVTALKAGDLPKTHTKDELDDDGSGEGEGGQASMIVGAPNIELLAHQLEIKAFRAEIGTYRQPVPDAQVVVHFAGTKPCRSGKVKANYNPVFQDKLLIPIFLPTFADRITIQLVDTADDDKVIAEAALSLLKLRAEEMEPQWINMYGPRPKPLSLGQTVEEAKEMAYNTAMKVSGGRLPEKIPSPEVDSAWRARLLVYALCEPTGPKNPKHQRMPMIMSASQIDEVEPEAEEFVLRCDLFEGVGWNLPPGGALYLVVAWGPQERKSKVNSPDAGKIIFESPLVTKVGCYELLDEIAAEQSIMDEQRYDVFLHVYVSTPFGDRRLGFKRYQTKALLIRNGWDPEPQWLTFTPDAENKEDVSMFTAQIQMKLLFGTRKEIDLFEPKRVHTKIPKLMRYEITANIFQGKDLQPADENGLSDPYVKVVMAGIERETAIIERTLQPIWYQRLTIPIDLPRDLNLAPKITLLVFDSDPFLGMKLNDPIIGFCQCPPEPITPDPDPDAKPRTMKEYFVRSGMGNDIQPEWVELFSNEGMEALAAHHADPIVNERPLNVGQLLVSFEIRPQQDALKIALQDAEDAKAARIEQARKQAEESGKKPNPLLEIMPAPKINYIRTMPKMIPCYLEVALVGVRDMRPISVAGIKKPVTAPYIEFEYGHRLAPERYWKTKTMVAGGGSSTGPNANFLEVIYLQVSLPDDPLYDPVMGVRVRDAAAGLPAVPGMPGFEPICGVASVPIKEKLPSFARHEKERIAREEEEEKERLRRIEAEDARKAEEGEVDLPDPPTAENEEVLEEFIFESTAGGGGGSRSVPDPDAQELGDSDDDSEDEDDEGEEGGKKEEGEPIITHPMESTLKDIPFESHKLHLGANKPTLQMGGIAFGSKRTVGILKMQLRVIEEENFLETIKSEPAPKLKAVFKEEMTKVRVHVYWATNLSVREDGKAPAPFLKVYNGTAAHQIKTTRNKSGNTTNPEFWTSFELAAMLPGDSQLKIEVWDYTILREMLIGGTTIDLEDRYYSKKWKEMQANEEVPRELRQLFTEASTNVQGNIIFKLQIFPAKFAKANPMEGLAPPKKTPMELRVVVWEAKDVATKDGGRSDVFITIQPRGESEYEKQSTDTHWFSTGEAEFNWRMIWPVFLPEKVPRLFMQVWDQDIIGADDAIGEAELNLKAMYDKALKKTMGQKQNGIWVDCHHPNFKGAQARVRLSIEVLTLPESLIKPAGRERNAPNENPYLEAPIRPGLFDGMGLAFNFSLINFGMLKKYLVRCCICCIIVGVIAGVVALQVM